MSYRRVVRYHRAAGWQGVWLPYFVLLVFLAGPSRAHAGKPLPDATEALRTYCSDCHGGGTSEGGFTMELADDDSLSLDQIDFANHRVADRWDGVHLRIERKMMPPEDADQPSEAERQLMLSAIENQLVRRAPIGGSPLRRLSRREYQQTIRTVFSLSDFELPNSFPQDNRVHGFDNQTSALVVTPAHLEAFAGAATQVADRLFPAPAPEVVSRRWDVPADELAISYSSGMMIDGEMRLASSNENLRRHAVWPSKFEAPARGVYRIHVTASSFGPVSQAAVLRAHAARLPAVERTALHDQTLSETPSTFSFDAELEQGEIIAFRYLNGPLDYEDVQALKSFLSELFQRDPRLAAAWHHLGSAARGGSGWEQLQRAMADESLEIESWRGADATSSDDLTALIERLIKNKVNTGETLVYKYFEEGPGIAIEKVTIEGPLRTLPSRWQQKATKDRRRFLEGRFSDVTADSTTEFVTWFLTNLFRRPAT
ncbi:MAG: DUF1587 domain-containing protein, partial [Planctomycetota bacterium]